MAESSNGVAPAGERPAIGRQRPGGTAQAGSGSTIRPQRSGETAQAGSESAAKPRRSAWWSAPRAAAVCAGALALLLLVAQTPPGLALLRAVGVLPKPDRYTVLAFAPSLLPPQSADRGARIAFAFTVGDEQGATADYGWRVLESTDGGPSVRADSGTLRLAAGATGTVSAVAAVPGAGKRVVITVQLLDPDQVIHYAVELKGSA
jgi:hypothetical protein